MEASDSPRYALMQVQVVHHGRHGLLWRISGSGPGYIFGGNIVDGIQVLSRS